MARTATKVTKRKPASKRVRSTSSTRGRSSNRTRGDARGNTAADALMKLLQSPLVAELLAVGATAALAALTEQRSGRSSSVSAGAKRALKGAVTAAAAAMGRRIASEFDDIKKAAKFKGAGAK